MGFEEVAQQVPGPRIYQLYLVDDEAWMDRMYAAWREFENDGAMPVDEELMSEAVLALAEAFELMACFVSKGSTERMAEFDRVACSASRDP